MSEVMPIAVAVSFAHAAVQALADDHNIRLMHIKGPAVDASLLELGTPDAAGGTVVVPRRSTDADIWVNPRQVDQLLDVMGTHGWTMKFMFDDDSPFAHAATLHRPSLGHVDLHRIFPGVGSDRQRAFDRLWRDHSSILIAGYPCWVPSVTAQRLILILHAARGGGGAEHVDIRRAWYDAGAEERAAVEELAKELDAEVALAAGTGRLDDYRHRREYHLWRVLATDRRKHSLPTVWIARVRAAGSASAALRTAIRLLLPKPQRLQMALGRPPTKREMFRAYFDRLWLAGHELLELLQRKRK